MLLLSLSLSPYNKWVQSFNKLISSVDERELVNNESQSPTKQTHTKVHTQISKNTHKKKNSGVSLGTEATWRLWLLFNR